MNNCLIPSHILPKLPVKRPAKILIRPIYIFNAPEINPATESHNIFTTKRITGAMNLKTAAITAQAFFTAWIIIAPFSSQNCLIIAIFSRTNETISDNIGITIDFAVSNIFPNDSPNPPAPENRLFKLIEISSYC
jgi:hypothetical protein